MSKTIFPTESEIETNLRAINKAKGFAKSDIVSRGSAFQPLQDADVFPQIDWERLAIKDSDYATLASTFHKYGTDEDADDEAKEAFRKNWRQFATALLTEEAAAIIEDVDLNLGGVGEPVPVPVPGEGASSEQQKVFVAAEGENKCCYTACISQRFYFQCPLDGSRSSSSRTSDRKFATAAGLSDLDETTVLLECTMHAIAKPREGRGWLHWGSIKSKVPWSTFNQGTDTANSPKRQQLRNTFVAFAKSEEDKEKIGSAFDTLIAERR